MLQLLRESCFSVVRKGFAKFTATQNITWNHYNIKVCKKDYSQDCLQKIQYFTKFRMLQLFLESCFLAVRKGFDNFTATQNITWYHYNIKVCKKDYSQGYLQKIQYFAEFCILQLFGESCYFGILPLQEDWATDYDTMASLL